MFQTSDDDQDPYFPSPKHATILDDRYKWPEWIATIKSYTPDSLWPHIDPELEEPVPFRQEPTFPESCKLQPGADERGINLTPENSQVFVNLVDVWGIKNACSGKTRHYWLRSELSYGTPLMSTLVNFV